jgi:DEAD/DEAH box helicase domain-containing protein
VLTFDIETKMLADEVGGWSNKHKMGVACLVALDSKDSIYHVYSLDDIPGTESLDCVIELFDNALNEGQVINGYNIIDFDFPVLEHELGIKNLSKKYLPVIVDPMQHIYKKLGFRIALQDIASLNFNESKTMDGKDAPMEWRKGNHKKVIDYCKKDVDLAYKLYVKGKSEGTLLYKDKFNSQPKKIKVTW